MIAIPILLFLLLALSFWILTDSKLHFYIRLSCVVGLFLFGLVFWKNTSSFLGWAADGQVLYNIPVTVHSVTVDEPNKTMKGAIYVTVRQPPSQYKSMIMRMFGHPIQEGEPRLYKFDYNRNMHEELQQSLMPRLQQQGQKGVRGKFKDPKGKKGGEKGDSARKGEGKGKEKGDGEGSHSQESEFWHDIIPRFEYDKNRVVPKGASPKQKRRKGKYLI